MVKVELKPKLDLLRDHGRSKRHVDKSPHVNIKFHQLPFKPVKSVPEEVKRLELKFAAMSVCHTSFRTIDHISEIMKEEGKGSIFENVKLHRTKTTALGWNVLSSAFSDELKEELRDKAFSILIVESTNIG